MYDQSFNIKTISRELRKSDFTYKPRLRDKRIKEHEIGLALSKANGEWDVVKSLLVSQIRGKFICRAATFSDELILRKLNRNLIEYADLRETNRDSIVANIREILREGIGYRVYRLDIKSFYESIDVVRALGLIEKFTLMSQPTKKNIRAVLESHAASGRSGVPRGLALSATITEIVMQDFDNSIKEIDGVFYYGRYVDDIIIVTDKMELPYKFIKLIKRALPDGLNLNAKKQMVCETKGDVTPHKAASLPVQELDFEYLGYRFLVASPVRNNKKRDGQHFRDVRLDIANSKVTKIKTRVARSLVSFNSGGDFELLRSRLKFLASNFSVMDADRDRKRLAGIFYNYHRADPVRSNALQELDSYLTNIISSGFGKVSDEFYSKTSLSQRRELLSIRFTHGFVNRVFLHFSNSSLGKVQECWKYV